MSIKVPTRKRSVLQQTHIRRLDQQLRQILHEQQYLENTSATGEKENDVLIIENTSWMTSSNETALGAMLLK